MARCILFFLLKCLLHLFMSLFFQVAAFSLYLSSDASSQPAAVALQNHLASFMSDLYKVLVAGGYEADFLASLGSEEDLKRRVLCYFVSMPSAAAHTDVATVSEAAAAAAPPPPVAVDE